MGFAIIWTTDLGYMAGTNGVLNSLEHYGFDVDSYVLTWGDFLSEEYKTQFPRTRFEVIKTDKYPGKPTKWYLRFMDVDYTIENLRSYDAVLIWGADVCPVSNFMDYFEVCAKLDRVIVGTNEHARYLNPPFVALAKEWPYVHTWTVPYADVPFFVSRGNFDLLELMLKYQRTEGCTLSHMDGMNYAIRDLGKQPFIVPGELWVHNVPSRTPLANPKPGVIHITGSNTRLHSFHRKYWNPILCRRYQQVNETSARNKLIFNKTWCWLNTAHRVKWTQGWELWDGMLS